MPDRSRRYAGCGAPFRGGPTSMRCRAVGHELTYPTPRANRKTTRSMMMRRFLVAFLLVAVAAESLSAQRRPRVFRTGEPGIWLTGGVAGFTATGVNDGLTASSWDFGSSTNLQYRASLEKTVGTGGSSFGISGSYARVPFVYRSDLLTPSDAHLDLMTLLATFHAGSGY